jgi:hypothetical protein
LVAAIRIVPEPKRDATRLPSSVATIELGSTPEAASVAATTIDPFLERTLSVGGLTSFTQ